MTLPLLAITGGLGRVAGVLRPHLRSAYRLRLVDRIAGPVEDGEELVVADLASASASEAVRDADAVLHLAADASPDATWDSLYRTNIALTRQVLDASVDVPRIVYASSVHAAGGDNSPERYPIDPTWAPRPCCAYGMSKVVGETLARYHADAHGASVICLRLGMTGFPLTHPGHRALWLSDDDAGRLVMAALSAAVRFGVYFGVSANSTRHWDITRTVRELGYAPQDDSADLLPGETPISLVH